jgi:hypothetical protein
MKYYPLLITVALLYSTAAFALGNNQHNDDGVAIQGSNVSHSTINNGAGSGSTSNSNRNDNTNVNVNSSHSSSSAKQHQSQSQSARSKSEVEGSGNSSNSYVEQAQKRNPVSTAYAAPLVTSDETCAYSTSVGAQFIGTGMSVGSTHEATNCVRLKNSRELERKGFKKAAIALLCLNDEVREAMEQESTPCPAKADKRLGALAPASGDTAVNQYPAQRSRFE